MEPLADPLAAHEMIGHASDTAALELTPLRTVREKEEKMGREGGREGRGRKERRDKGHREGAKQRWQIVVKTRKTCVVKSIYKVSRRN